MYFDFKKAFDMVNHSKLILKLQSFGFDPLLCAFIKEFLSNRHSCVKINSSFSYKWPVISGVPQGSVLGPLLFLIYVNDISLSFPDDINFAIFADDLKIYGSNPLSIQNTIDIVSLWSSGWDLPLAENKIQLIHLGKGPPPQLSINGTSINATCRVRDLGIIIDDKLKFDAHVSHIVRLACLRSKQILNVFKSKRLEVYISLYKTFIRPLLEYATEIFNPKENSSLSKTLEHTLRSYSRKVFRRCSLSFSNYSHRLTIMSLDSQKTRRIKSDLCTAYKLINGDLLPLISNHTFTLLSSASNRSQRQHHLTVKVTRDIFNDSNWFFARCTRRLNRLPSSIVSNVINLNTFKTALNEVPESFFNSIQ